MTSCITIDFVVYLANRLPHLALCGYPGILWVSLLKGPSYLWWKSSYQTFEWVGWWPGVPDFPEPALLSFGSIDSSEEFLGFLSCVL